MLKPIQTPLCTSDIFFRYGPFKKIPVKSILDISSGSVTFGTAGECVWNMQVALGLSRQEAGHSPTHTRICEYPELLPRCIFSRAYSDMIWKCDRGVGRRRFVSHITFLKCQESGCTLLFCFGFLFCFVFLPESNYRKNVKYGRTKS